MKELIKHIKGKKWYNQAAEAKPLYIYPPATAAAISMRRIMKVAFEEAVLHFRRGYGSWFINEDHMKHCAKILLRRHHANPDYFLNIHKEWQEQGKPVHTLVAEINELDFDKLSDKELFDLFKKLYVLFQKCWDYVIYIDFFDLHGEQLLEEGLSTKLSDENHHLLLLADQLAYIEEEHRDFLKIALAYFEKSSKITQLLEAHQKKYYWVQNNYGHVTHLGMKDFYEKLTALVQSSTKSKIRKELEEFSKKSQLRAKKKRLLAKLSEKDRELYTAFSELGYYRDQRKKFNLIGITAMRYVVYKISQRLKIDVGSLEYYTPKEILELRKNERSDLYNARERKEGVLFYFEDRKVDVFIGEEAKHIFDLLTGQNEDQQEIKGLTACKGSAQGRVRIINKVTDFSKMKQGDILVTSMTRPEFTPLMKKAGAIVTDEGGITSHASVVSRELGVPCIIGTRNASKVLKDDDEVIVQADKGIVRRV